jgi:putative transposase
VARELTTLVEYRGKLGLIVSDNERLDGLGASQHCFALYCTGQPMQNAFCRSLNSGMRDELPNETLFWASTRAADRMLLHPRQTA